MPSMVLSIGQNYNRVLSDQFLVGGSGYENTTDSYEYYPNGNLKSVKTNGFLLAEYFYDQYNRLVMERNQDKEVRYAYDNGGNITSKQEYTLYGSLIKTDTYSYTKPWKDQLTSISGSSGTEYMSYDGVGNPISYKGVALSWTNGRQLASYYNFTNRYLTFEYDYAGYRTKKANGQYGDVYYYWQGDQLMAEQNGSQGFIWYYYDETGVCGMNYGGYDHIFRKNILGDITGIYMLLNNSVFYVGGYSYDAWGNQTLDDPGLSGAIFANPFRYRGYYYDQETGLYYLQSRYYDPTTGRFVNADDPTTLFYTAAEVGGANLYAYCYNNPVLLTDPTGESALLIGLIALVSVLLVTEVASYYIPDSKTLLLVNSVTTFVTGMILAFTPAAGLGYAMMGSSIGGLAGGMISESLGGSFTTGYTIGSIVGGLAGAGAYNYVTRPLAPHISGTSTPRKLAPNAIYYNTRTEAYTYYDSAGYMSWSRHMTDHGFLNHVSPHWHLELPHSFPLNSRFDFMIEYLRRIWWLR